MCLSGVLKVVHLGGSKLVETHVGRGAVTAVLEYEAAVNMPESASDLSARVKMLPHSLQLPSRRSIGQ